MNPRFKSRRLNAQTPQTSPRVNGIAALLFTFFIVVASLGSHLVGILEIKRSLDCRLCGCYDLDWGLLSNRHKNCFTMGEGHCPAVWEIPRAVWPRNVLDYSNCGYHPTMD